LTPEAQEHRRQNITPADERFLGSMGIRSRPLFCDVANTDETLVLLYLDGSQYRHRILRDPRDRHGTEYVCIRHGGLQPISCLHEWTAKGSRFAVYRQKDDGAVTRVKDFYE
jgi:hypothetical protein